MRQFVANPRASQDFDLSRNRSLRTLETIASLMDFSYPAGWDFFKAVLSSITFPAPLDVVIIYRNDDFNARAPCKLCAPQPNPSPSPHYYGRCYSPPVRNRFSLRYRSHFAALREMHSVREFSLVFCLDVSDCMMCYALGELNSVLRWEKESGEFDYLLDGPIVTCERRVLCTGPRDPHVRSMAVMPPVSAL